MKAAARNAARIALVAMLVAFAILLSASALSPRRTRRAVVLISIDGLHPDYVTAGRPASG